MTEHRVRIFLHRQVRTMSKEQFEDWAGVDNDTAVPLEMADEYRVEELV